MREIGFIEVESKLGGGVRYRVVLKSKGVRYRIAEKEIAPGLCVPFSSRETAQETLDGIRHLLALGHSIHRAVAQFLPTLAPEDLVENRLAEYLDYFGRLVDQGKRSPSTIRELARYAKPGGHFSYWFKLNARELTFGQVEDWHGWLGERGISFKTQKNISNSFRAFLRRLKRRDEAERVPDFPAIEVPEYAPTIITPEQQATLLNAIPRDRRGLFLCASFEVLRAGELRALVIDDYDDGRLRITKAIQGKGKKERVAMTKNRTARVKELWSNELIEWIEWRVSQSTTAQRLRGEVSLFPNPTGRHPTKRWGHSPIKREWERACEKARIFVSFQEGTRHCTITRFAEVMPERVLQEFTGHKDPKSLSHYAKPRATKATIRKITGGGDG